MRRNWILAALLGLAWPVSLSWAQDPAGGRAGAKPRAATSQPAPTPKAENTEARRLEEARHKRWDERMRRATRSLCDRC
jgi:hypothetical protein